MIDWNKEKDTNTTGGNFKYTAHDGRVVVEFDWCFKKWYGYVNGEFIAANKRRGEVMRIIEGR